MSYVGKKKDALIKQVGVNNYNSTYNIAKGVFYAVEQQFKLIPGAGNLKATMFYSLLLARIPGLTKDETEHFREAICGEINNQLKSTSLLAPAYDPSIDSADVKITQGSTESAVNNQTVISTVAQ